MSASQQKFTSMFHTLQQRGSAWLAATQLKLHDCKESLRARLSSARKAAGHESGESVAADAPTN